MSEWFPFCPAPPDWRIDWPAIHAAFGWVRELAGCPQNPTHHAEGDVWTHTRMACEALADLASFRALPLAERTVVVAATLLHDVAKPACTRRDVDGCITTFGHSRRGAIQARAILWRMGVPFTAREQAVALVRHHQAPFFLLERPDAQRVVIEVSQTARCDLLALLAEADARGRVCADQSRLLDGVALFAEYCREQDCLMGPYRFPSDHARFLYFRLPNRDPAYPAHDDTRCDVTLLSGLPGAGKDRWLERELPGVPVISLDALRSEMGVRPSEPQGPVIDRARELARGYLRAGRAFAWNGTNLRRELRGHCIDLFAAYGARVHIMYVEVPEARLRRQNRGRPAPVPESVIERLLARWEVPDRTEAHRVEWIVGT